MLGPVVALVAAGSYPRPPIARTPSTAPNNTRARATNAATAPRTGGRRCSDNLTPCVPLPGGQVLRTQSAQGWARLAGHAAVVRQGPRIPHSLAQPMRRDGGCQNPNTRRISAEPI